MQRPRPWLTPKSDSLESFLVFAVRLMLAIALMATVAYLALDDRLTAASGTALLVAAAGLLPRRFEP